MRVDYIGYTWRRHPSSFHRSVTKGRAFLGVTKFKVRKFIKYYLINKKVFGLQDKKVLT